MTSTSIASKDLAATANEPAAQAGKPPLLVDLDRSLIRTDILLETALAYLGRNPFGIFNLLAWMLRGRAYLCWQR